MSAKDMTEILKELESAASHLGIKVSYEAIASTVGGGGLCKVNGAYRVIVDKRGTVGEKLATLAKSIGEVDPKGNYDGDDTAPELSQQAHDVLQRYRQA